MSKVLFINGIRDSGIVRVNKIIDNNRLQYINQGTCNLYPYLKDCGHEVSLITLDANADQDVTLGTYDTVFNQISDADTHRTSLAKASRICEYLKNNVRIINHPDRIADTTRDKIHHSLARVPGLVSPRTTRSSASSPSDLMLQLAENDWSYPVLIRFCGDHNARSLVLIDRPEATEKLGHDYFERECYLTGFVDYSDDDGVFAKLRLVWVLDQVFIRHAVYSDHWKIRADVRDKFMKQNSQYLDAEIEIMERFRYGLKTEVTPAMQQISAKIGLEYFGVDCSIDSEGRLLIFEANANMNLLYNPYPSPNLWQAQQEAMYKALVSML